MKFEVLKKNHLKRNILIAVIVVLILTAIILTFTRAKYRTTQSMPLLQGTINFSPSDLNLMAVYLNKGSETISSDKVPHVGYTLNTEQSLCEINNVKDETIEIIYENGLLNFNGLGNKGTKCTAYFDLIPDSENPVLNQFITTGTNDTNIRVTVDASDNVGVFYYYYKLDDKEEIRTEENIYTFEGLVTDQVYNITVRVEDAAGNISETQSKEAIAGYSPIRYILANEGGAAEIEAKGTPNFASAAITDEGIYAAEDDWGTSYYYRGAVQDNWIQFGTNASGQNLYWRIMRINGDGTLRLIYNGTSTATTGTTTQIQTSTFNSSNNNNMYVGYMYQSDQVHGLTSPSTIKGILDTWYQNNLTDEVDNIEGSTGFCGDRISYTNTSGTTSGGGTGTTRTYYGGYIRLITNKTPNLKCPYEDGSGIKQDLYTTSGSGQGNQVLTNPIGLISADEVAMAGGVNGSNNTSYYLYTGQNYWTLSPYSSYSNYAGVFVVNDGGYLSGSSVTYTFGIRPVINIRSDVQLTGTGTSTDPYVVQ